MKIKNYKHKTKLNNNGFPFKLWDALAQTQGKEERHTKRN